MTYKYTAGQILSKLIIVIFFLKKERKKIFEHLYL